MAFSSASSTGTNPLTAAAACRAASPQRLPAPRYHRIELAPTGRPPMIAVIRVDISYDTADIEGLIWSDGKVIQEVDVSISLAGRTLEAAVTDAMKRALSRRESKASNVVELLNTAAETLPGKRE